MVKILNTVVPVSEKVFEDIHYIHSEMIKVLSSDDIESDIILNRVHQKLSVDEIKELLYGYNFTNDLIRVMDRATGVLLDINPDSFKIASRALMCTRSIVNYNYFNIIEIDQISDNTYCNTPKFDTIESNTITLDDITYIMIDSKQLKDILYIRLYNTYYTVNKKNLIKFLEVYMNTIININKNIVNHMSFIKLKEKYTNIYLTLLENTVLKK